jgi:hypothetical protein
MMVKEFDFHIAWIDVMKEGESFVGIIEYQPKSSFSHTRSCPQQFYPQPFWVQVLWVFSGKRMCEEEAKYAAMDMLDQIDEITFSGKVLYKDGVML